MADGLYREFARFFENPTRQRLLDLLEMNYGEQDNLDFKRDWPPVSKVARHMLALANIGGGCLVFGVAELESGGFEPVGLSEIMDKSDIAKKLERYLPPELPYELLDFHFDSTDFANINGKSFQVILVENDPEHIPFVTLAGDHELRENAVYVREGTSSMEADYEELQTLINRRVETGRSTSSELWLDKRLSELRVLYSHLEKNRRKESNEIGPKELTFLGYDFDSGYESFENFVTHLIENKKQEISKFLKSED